MPRIQLHAASAETASARSRGRALTGLAPSGPGLHTRTPRPPLAADASLATIGGGVGVRRRMRSGTSNRARPAARARATRGWDTGSERGGGGSHAWSGTHIRDGSTFDMTTPSPSPLFSVETKVRGLKPRTGVFA